MIKRRMYVGKLLDADNELDAMTRRQTITVIRTAESYPLELDEDIKPARDWTLTIAAVGVGVSIAGLILGVVLAIVWP